MRAIYLRLACLTCTGRAGTLPDWHWRDGQQSLHALGTFLLAHSLQPSTRNIRRRCRPTLNTVSEESAVSFIDEVNTLHVPELAEIAKAIGAKDGYDWTQEDLTQVKLVGANESGLVLDEVICDASSCVELEKTVPWPKGTTIENLLDMRSAFTTMANNAHVEVPKSKSVVTDIHNAFLGGSPSPLPPQKHEAQQAKLAHVMRIVNSEFSNALKHYALQNLSGEEIHRIETAEMTQLKFNGFSLVLSSGELDDSGRTSKVQWSTHFFLFPQAASSVDEVEETLLRLLDDVTAS